jgi:XTP/dITP diphosphohydrolase
MNTIWLATFNSGKIREFQTLFDPKHFNFKIAKELANYSAPEETGTTFLENAKLKADSLYSVLNTQQAVIAEDSGLVVEGLNGFPGIFSARYAGDKASDAQNCDKVLKMVKIRTPQMRKAKFVSCLYFKGPDFELHAQGEVHGEISISPRGASGFGYDPIFIPEGYTQTMAELGLAVKNKISHRKLAAQTLKQALLEKSPEWFN